MILILFFTGVNPCKTPAYGVQVCVRAYGTGDSVPRKPPTYGIQVSISSFFAFITLAFMVAKCSQPTCIRIFFIGFKSAKQD